MLAGSALAVGARHAALGVPAEAAHPRALAAGPRAVLPQVECPEQCYEQREGVACHGRQQDTWSQNTLTQRSTGCPAPFPAQPRKGRPDLSSQKAAWGHAAGACCLLLWAVTLRVVLTSVQTHLHT